MEMARVMARSLRHQTSGWMEMSRRERLSHRYSSLNPPQPTAADQALFQAIDKRCVDMVNRSLEEGANIDAVNGFFGESALHHAARIKWRPGVELLLNKGAMPNIENKFFQTPLHFTAVAGCAECLSVLLTSDKTAVFVQDMRGFSPLHDAALGEDVRCVKLLLEAGADVNLRDNQGETPLHKCAKAGNVASIVALLNGGADLKAKNAEGETALAVMLRNIPRALSHILDHCLVPNTLPKNNKNFEMTINFKPLIREEAMCHTDLIQSFIKIGESEVLKHPVCQAFLRLKWHRVVKLFLFKLLFYLVFVLVTTFFVLDELVWDGSNTAIYGERKVNASAVSKMSSDNRSDVQTTGRAGTYKTMMRWETGLYWTAVAMIVVLATHEFVNILSSASNYFSSVVSYLNWLLFFTFFAVSADANGAWQTHLAAFYILFLWSKAMHLIGQFPGCGVYVSMFIRVAAVFCKIFLVYFSLLVAFSLSFHLSFRTEKAFKDPINSFLKTLTLMIGEVDYEGLFLNKSRPPLFATSHIIFFLFLVLVSIILSNLLVALAVNDVQGLRQGAHLERLKKQSQLIHNTELMTTFLKSLFRCTWLQMAVKPILDSVHLDLLSKRVFILPNHPQKSRYLQILDYKTKNIREHKISKEMLELMWRALQRQDVPDPEMRSPSLAGRPGVVRRNTAARPPEQDGLLRMHRGREVSSARAVTFEDIKDLLNSLEMRLTAQIQRKLDNLRTELTEQVPISEHHRSERDER